MPCAEVTLIAIGREEPSPNTWTWAPKSGASDESTTLRISSEARVMVGKHEKTTMARSRERERITSSFTRERGSVLRFAPVSWLASKDVRLGRAVLPRQNFHPPQPR